MGWRVYVRLQALGIRARALYRLDFAAAVLTAIVTQAGALAFYWLASSRAPTLGGWAANDVLMLFGFTALVLGTAELCFNGIWSLPRYVASGEMDRLLLYPARSLTLLLTARPEPHALGNIGTSIVLLGLSWRDREIPASVWFLVPFWVACGVAVYTSALTAIGSLYLGIIAGPAADLLLPIHQLLHAARYPVSLYPAWLRALLMVIVPVGAAIYCPLEWIVGKGSLWRALLVPPLAATVSVLLAAAIWERALSRYQSTGS